MLCIEEPHRSNSKVHPTPPATAQTPALATDLPGWWHIVCPPRGAVAIWEPVSTTWNRATSRGRHSEQQRVPGKQVWSVGSLSWPRVAAGNTTRTRHTQGGPLASHSTWGFCPLAQELSGSALRVYLLVIPGCQEVRLYPFLSTVSDSNVLIINHALWWKHAHRSWVTTVWVLQPSFVVPLITNCCTWSKCLDGLPLEHNRKS